MDYRVEYWTSSDGTAIASGRAGRGYPLLRVPLLDTTIESFSWDMIPQGFETIIYDRRGTGLSERGRQSGPGERYVEDVQAVIDGLALDRFALIGNLAGAPEAIAVAARNSGRVSHLVLQTPAVSVRDWTAIPRMRALLSVMEEDWPWFTDVWVRGASGWDNPAGGPRALQLREQWSPEQLRQLIDGLSTLDISQDLQRVDARTLLVHAQGFFFPDSYARQIASRIPDCEVAVLPRPIEDGLEAARAAELAWDFLSDVRMSAAPAVSAPVSGFQTILFTDLESSTALTQRLGDEGAQELLRGHNDAVRAALEVHDGREVKHTGDGIMASFPSAVSAVRAALAMQRELAGGEVRVRIGLNAGEPIAEDDDLFGIAVIKASRICDRAEPGQVLVANVVRELCAGKGFEFTSVGEATLKGFDEPVALYEAASRAR